MGALNDTDLKAKFWTELSDLRTGMLGLADAPDRHAQPMTAHFDDGGGAIWFYAPAHAQIVKLAKGGHHGMFHYASRAHDLYACVSGELDVDRNQAIIDRFWSDDVAHWFPDRNSPDVTLLRFEPHEAQIWIPTEGLEPRTFDLGGAPADVRGKVAL